MNQYATWIRQEVSDPHGTCHASCLRMQAQFPELVLRRGHYHCPLAGPRPHWWLTTPEGAIVDPTAAQFPSLGQGDYVELDPDQPEPTGRCAGCGEYCYDGAYFCGAACEAAVMLELGFHRPAPGGPWQR